MKHFASAYFESAWVAFAWLAVALLADSPVWGQEEVPVSRQPWTASKLVGTPEPSLPFEAVRAFPKLTFKEPVEMTRTPNRDRLFVAERFGKVFSFVPNDSVTEGDLFFDVKSIDANAGEVYGLAFHPEYPVKPLAYICYIIRPNDPKGTRVSEFQVRFEDGKPVAETSSERILIEWLSGGHNGGCLRFGPDNLLYISTGDAGPASPPDPLRTGQDNRDLLSSLLRIDVNSKTNELPYGIPNDNPFVDREECRPEIWAFGFRNPWKFSFAPESNDLWLGDVGWELWEMIYRVERGGNYGWSIVEGHQPVLPNEKVGPTPILPPTVEHSHRDSRSITGGFVCESNRIPELRGAYIYGDYETGKVWGLKFAEGRETWQAELADTNLKIVSFGIGLDGDLFLVDFNGGIYRLEPNQHGSYNEKFPRLLSETGLFKSVRDQIPETGVVSYSISAETWQDGTVAKRFVAIPKLGTIRPEGLNWHFPEGSVLAKTISMSDSSNGRQTTRHIETQILVFDGQAWSPYSYLWNEEQSDAELVASEGTTVPLSSPMSDDLALSALKSWRVPSRAECSVCHTTFFSHMSVLSFEAAQLQSKGNPELEAQYKHLIDSGLFASLPQAHPRPVVNPYDSALPLEDRALSYLHTNCRHCHRDGGGGGSTMKLEIDRADKERDMFGARAQHGDFGLINAALVNEGNPFSSVILARTSKIGSGRMPYKGSETIDEEGIALLREWIESRKSPDASESDSNIAELSAILATPNAESKIDQIRELCKTSSSALAFAHLLYESKLDTELKTKLAAGAIDPSNPSTRDFLEPFLPPSQRSTRLGRDFDSAEILKLSGNAAVGKDLFFSLQTQCSNCHRVQGRGNELGPDLSQLGKKYSKSQILQEVRDPSRTIDPKFSATTFQLKDGEVVTGIVIEKSDSLFTVRDQKGNKRVIDAKAIEELRVSSTSMMPDNVLESLTAQQLADLLEYMSALK